MPGKVNPTQCEAMTMLCAQVHRQRRRDQHRRRVGQLRAQRLQAADHPQLPAERAPARRRLRELRRALRARASSPTASASPSWSQRSLMLVTALNPHIGYDKAAKIAKKAHHEGHDAARGGGRARPRQRGAVRCLGASRADGRADLSLRLPPRYFTELRAGTERSSDASSLPAAAPVRRSSPR